MDHLQDFENKGDILLGFLFFFSCVCMWCARVFTSVEVHVFLATDDTGFVLNFSFERQSLSVKPNLSSHLILRILFPPLSEAGITGGPLCTPGIYVGHGMQTLILLFVQQGLNC